ncbi:RQC domain-containing protein [Paenibacillus oceani]|uniref:Superfamily II DNA helicase n=1 Tax=Paenibacillus oceani TaxID=2772510 RepID=A0A927CER4_9BACL|nr:RQC-minor-1 family DNA-binding protein [Paenibacillus oceani]MBD2864626.1 superfamily II DNA helicase [Paenibacillus oceani]
MKTKNIPLPEPELRAILRGADDIIAEGGRTLLSKILKGSKERKLLELGLDRNPSYGFYRDLSLEQITDKVDQMIRTGFLKTEVVNKLPRIAFTPRGWAVERERRAEEFVQEWDRWLENDVTPISMEYLKERDRSMIFLFLFKMLCSGDRKYVPFLELWERVDFKRVRVEIQHVIDALKQRERLSPSDWERLIEERIPSLLLRSREPVILACRQCGRPFVWDELNPECYTTEGLRFPELCPNCMED